MSSAKLEALLKDVCQELQKNEDQRQNLSFKLENFYATLLSSRIFILLHEPLPADVRDEHDILKAGTDIPIVTLYFPDGQPCVPAFTSMELLSQFIQEETEYMQIHGHDLFRLVQNTGIMLNNNSEYRLRITPKEIQYALEFFDSKEIVIEEPTSIEIGRPAVDPVGLKEAIAEKLIVFDNVNSAYLSLGINPVNQQHSYLIVLDMVSGTEIASSSIQQVLGDAAHGWLPKGYFIDFLENKNDNSVAQYVVETGDCFYRKTD